MADLDPDQPRWRLVTWGTNVALLMALTDDEAINRVRRGGLDGGPYDPTGPIKVHGEIRARLATEADLIRWEAMGGHLRHP